MEQLTMGKGTSNELVPHPKGGPLYVIYFNATKTRTQHQLIDLLVLNRLIISNVLRYKLWDFFLLKH